MVTLASRNKEGKIHVMNGIIMIKNQGEEDINEWTIHAMNGIIMIKNQGEEDINNVSKERKGMDSFCVERENDNVFVSEEYGCLNSLEIKC